MKTLISFLSLTIFSLFLYSSCSQQNEVVEKNYEIPNALKIVENYNVGKHSRKKASLINGAVEIVTTQNEIVLFISENGKQDLMYVLQQKKSDQKQDLRETISSAQILFFHRNLIINSLVEDSKLVFTIDKELPSYLDGIKINNTFSGYGLVRQPGVTLSFESIDDFHGIATIYSLRKDVIANQAGVRAGDSGYESAVECGCCVLTETSNACTDMALGNCDAGGSNSTSCDISASDGTSCSVTCTDDVDGACCNDTSNDTGG